MGEATEAVEKPSTTAKKKVVAKKKAAAKKATVKKAAVKQVDLIVETATNLETLKKKDAFKMVGELVESVDYTYFQLGGVLSVIQSNEWFLDEGYETFKAFVETNYGINYRKAVYLVAIYNGLVESEVEWKKVKDLGWTKLKELAAILTPDNVDEWVKQAKSMTVLQLIEYIKEQKAGSLDSSGSDMSSESSKVTTMTFKVHEDQKEIIKAAVDKGKEEAETEFDAVALEAICLTYINSGSPKKAGKQKSLKALMKDSGNWEEVLETFGEIWPEVDITVTV